MDLIKELMELNNTITLEKIAEEKYTIDSDDEEEDIEYIKECRKKFINRYNKVNNRQFTKTRYYYLDEYYQKMIRLERKFKIPVRIDDASIIG